MKIDLSHFLDEHSFENLQNPCVKSNDTKNQSCKKKLMIFYTLWQRDVMATGKTCRAYPLESQVNSFHNWLKLILKEDIFIPLYYHKMI